MKTFVPIEVNYRGRLHRVEYLTKDQKGETKNKYCQVYTPFEYDDKRPYNILYILHGSGGSPDTWIDCSHVKNMLDYAFWKKEAEPMIVVFPTFYDEIRPDDVENDQEWESNAAFHFMKEIVNDLIPAVECRFHTYSEKITDQSIKDARMHRGFGGFSMGSCNTWYCFLENLDFFSTFVPMSGDCWAVAPMGGLVKTKETVDLIASIPLKKGYRKDQYKVFAATGTGDVAYGTLTPMVEEMKTRTEVFDFSEDYGKGNLHYLLETDRVHTYEDVYQYLYNYLPYLFN